MTDRARGPVACEPANIRLTCPLCEQDLIRVARLPADRLASLFKPLYRYRCRQHQCQWEGTLRFDDPLPTRKPAR